MRVQCRGRGEVRVSESAVSDFDERHELMIRAASSKNQYSNEHIMALNGAVMYGSVRI